jgi:hypothetical protein
VTSTRSGAAKRRPGGKPAATARQASRRKPKQPTEPRKQRSRLTWQGFTMTIRYDPASFADHAHIQLQVIAPERNAPLPVTETGYRSHFVRPEVVEAAGGPTAYVRVWLEEASRSPSWRARLNQWRQLSLF